MISEEQLRIAAKETHAQYIEELLNSGDFYAPHTFSPEFERKMEKLINSIGKRSLRRVLQKVACFFLALIASASVWLSVDAQARSKVLGWVKEVCGDWLVVHFEGSEDKSGAEKTYRPSWIPEGYQEYMVSEIGATVVIMYSNEEDKFIEFAYSYEPDDTYWFHDVSGRESVVSEVNKKPAELYISDNPKQANKIMWVSSEGTAFFVSAFLDEDNLIKFAENIYEMAEK